MGSSDKSKVAVWVEVIVRDKYGRVKYVLSPTESH